MTSRHLEFLVEEPSMEAFLSVLLPRLLPEHCTFLIHTFQGKPDLLGKLEARLKGYAHWPSSYGRVVVVVDCDDEDCRDLKRRLEDAASAARLGTRSSSGKKPWQVVNRIAIEELEAWYFGDWEAVRCAYPRVAPTVPSRASYRDPDAIKGGTWEAFERILNKGGYFRNGLRKVEAARAIAPHIDPERSHSRSFARFRDVLIDVMSCRQSMSSSSPP